MFTQLWSRSGTPIRPGLRNQVPRKPVCRLNVETLENRLVLSGDMVLRWNEALFATVQAASPPNPVAARAAAIVQAAVYEAVNSIDGSYSHYLVDIPAPRWASKEAAAAEAAHDALVDLFPSQAPVLDLELLASLQGIQPGDAKTWGISVGHAAAQIMLAVRAHDGSDRVVTYTPGTDPGDWQPTPPAYLPASLPGWGMVTPFCLQSGSQFRPPPPPALTSAEYTAAFNEVKDLGSFDSTTRIPDQTEAAIFWQGVYASPNCFLTMLNQIARQVSQDRGISLVDNARLFALLDLTLADSYIASWEAKYTYNFWRPVTAIRYDTDPNWTPLMATPNFPSYASAHSTVVAGSAAILASFFGTDAIPFSVSYAGLPGVTRSYDSFTAAANECGLSRIWVGFHWSFDVTAGLAQGQSIGSYISENFLLPRNPGPGHGGIGLPTPAAGEASALPASVNPGPAAPSPNSPGLPGQPVLHGVIPTSSSIEPARWYQAGNPTQAQPLTVPARPAQGEAPAPSQPSASEVVGLERWFASLHGGDYVWLTVPRLNHQARGDTTLGMADLFGGEDLLFP
jgi:hypothetical protein